LANDPNEPGTACSSIRWASSNPADAFSGDCNGTVTFPSTGSRTLTASATDSQGATGSAIVTVTVVNIPAGQATIYTPADPSTVNASGTDSGGRYALVNFSGSATYSDGSTAPASRLVWYSNQAGSTPIGTGNNFTGKLYGAACTSRTHTVTMQVLNGDGTLNNSAITRVTIPGQIC
ncbi:MAG TPA: hypothetical protein VNT60_04420, partial [Deinococcales bacterium]|nr:hypothetical protein [Deinococcales bacterium]